MNKSIMLQAGFKKEVDLAEVGFCPFCSTKIDEEDFKDNLSRKEFKISGLCQSCQDGVFTPAKKERVTPRPSIGPDDYLLERNNVTSWGGPKADRTFTMHIGKSGKIWLVGNCEDAASEIFVSASANENKPGYRGFQGFGGATLKFTLTTEEIIELPGPWHSNSGALFADTGVDIRDKHLTLGIIAKDREYIPGSYHLCVFRDVLHRDEKPVLGDFYRVMKIAMELSKKLNEKLVCYSESRGGSSNGWIYPDQIDVHGKRQIKNA